MPPLEGCDCPLCSPKDIGPEDVSMPVQASANDEILTTTPLPKLQLSIATAIQVAEPITASVIYPFVNNLVNKIGVKADAREEQKGYRVGVIGSLFYASQALTVLHWGRASDTIGRRPIILGGTLGLAVSMMSFGLSKSYWALLLTRFAQGAFNGNVGVAKSVMAEITDISNAPQAFSFMPVASTIGATLGPLIGGNFAEPAQRWPEIFGGIDFFQIHPYFLPCMIAALVPLLSSSLGYFGLKETLPPAVAAIDRLKQIDTRKGLGPIIADEFGFPTPTSRLLPQASSSTSNTYGTTDDSTGGRVTASTLFATASQFPSMCDCLVPRVITTIINYAFFVFLDQSMLSLIPLIYSSPRHMGGLGLTPSAVGNIFGIWGVVNSSVQIFCFTFFRNRLGQRACYMVGIAGLGCCFALFPVLSHLATGDGDRVGCRVWLGIALQLGIYSFAYMSYACILLYIAASAPTPSSLGTTNSLAQLSASSARALAPSALSFISALSAEQGTSFRKYLTYEVLCTISIIAVISSVWLPKDPGQKGKQQSMD